MNMTTLMTDTSSLIEREESPIPSLAYVRSSTTTITREEELIECSSSSSSSSSSNNSTPMTTANSLPFYMTPPPPTTSSHNDDYDTMMQEYQQFPSTEEFEAIVNHYLQNLSSKKRDKALVDSHRYKLILQVLKDPRNTAISTAQFRFWVKKMFRLSTSDYMEFVCHDDKPVATREDIYNILIIAHKEAHHGGRDKTSALVRKRYSWIPKELIARFVRHCPFCISRRNGQNTVTLPATKTDYHSPPPLSSAALLSFLSSPSTPATGSKKRKHYQSHDRQPHWSNRKYSYEPNYSMAAHVATSAAAAAVAITSGNNSNNNKPLTENPFDFFYSQPAEEHGEEGDSPKPNLFATQTTTTATTAAATASTTTLPPYSYLLFSTNNQNHHNTNNGSAHTSSAYTAPSSAAAAAVVAAAAMAAVNSNQPTSPTVSCVSSSCASLDQTTSYSLHNSTAPVLPKENETTVSETTTTPTFITTC